jgi:hypothetical protein
MDRWVAWAMAVAVCAGHEGISGAGLKQPEHVESSSPLQVTPRVRGTSPAIAQAITDAQERSSTFRRLVDTISGSDGLVFVHQGVCGRGVRACLVLGLTHAGPYRMLHIRVDSKKQGLDLMVSIGHELRHTIEVLSDPSVVNTPGIRQFYERLAPTNRFRFETQAAIETELQIDAELREWTRRQRESE